MKIFIWFSALVTTALASFWSGTGRLDKVPEVKSKQKSLDKVEKQIK